MRELLQPFAAIDGLLGKGYKVNNEAREKGMESIKEEKNKGNFNYGVYGIKNK